MDDQGRSDRGRLLAGMASLLMAALIAGAQLGIIPADAEAFFAPPPVITALWVGLLLGAILFLLPQRSPAALEGGCSRFWCFVLWRLSATGARLHPG